MDLKLQSRRSLTICKLTFSIYLLLRSLCLFQLLSHLHHCWVYRGQAEKEFRVEVEAIGHVRHKNLVRLLGYCVEGVNRYVRCQASVTSPLSLLFSPFSSLHASVQLIANWSFLSKCIFCFISVCFTLGKSECCCAVQFVYALDYQAFIKQSDNCDFNYFLFWFDSSLYCIKNINILCPIVNFVVFFTSSVSRN
jgi:hypothetical protein